MEDGILVTTMLSDIQSILLGAGRGISASTSGLDNVFPPEELCSGSETQCNIYATCILTP